MFKLNLSGTAANKVGTGEWHNVEASAEYLAWLSEGNTPEPVDVPPPPTPQEQIRALEAQYADAQAKLTRQVILSQALDKAMTDPLADGMTREQVHDALLATSNGYAALWNLEQQVEALRVQV